MAAAAATAQTGAIVITNGRMVSLAECESRSNAMKTMTVPIISSAKPTIRAGHLSDFMLGGPGYFDEMRWSIESRPGPVSPRLKATVPSSSENS